jgi:lipopolysaccharide export system protein LptA
VLKSGGTDSGGPHKRPAMLRDDQPVNVTAKQLAYDSRGGSAVYTGDARLWQRETAIQGGVITLDDRQGNLTAKTNVKSTWRLDDTDPKTGKTDKKTTVGTGQDFVYEDALRRATYTTGARLVGPEGDLRATKIELYLDAEGSALERLEAYEAVTLRSGTRTSTGARMTYFAQDARYVMNGAPVRVLEQLSAECRETVGRSLTFFRTTDTILVDGNEQDRTQSTSGGKCSAPPPAP